VKAEVGKPNTDIELPSFRDDMTVSARGRDQRRTPMNLSFATLWRVGLLASIVWAIGGALDGASPLELLAVPVIVAAWLSAVVLIDRWVTKGLDQE